MTRLFYFWLSIMVLVPQAPDEPYPGQSTHATPPEGWFCEHQNYALSIPPAHACACERSTDEHGVVHEDPGCTAWCHADHCHCDMEGQ